MDNLKEKFESETINAPVDKFASHEARHMDKVQQGTPNWKNAFDFHVREYATLRREIELLNQDISRMLVYSVIATFAIWSWIATSTRPLPKAVWWIPVVITLLGLARSRSQISGIFKIAAYLRDLENHVLQESPLIGWEN